MALVSGTGGKSDRVTPHDDADQSQKVIECVYVCVCSALMGSSEDLLERIRSKTHFQAHAIAHVRLPLMLDCSLRLWWFTQRSRRINIDMHLCSDWPSAPRVFQAVESSLAEGQGDDDPLPLNADVDIDPDVLLSPLFKSADSLPPQRDPRP